MLQLVNPSRDERAAACVADEPVIDTSPTLSFQKTAASQQSRRNVSRIGFRRQHRRIGLSEDLCGLS